MDTIKWNRRLISLRGSRGVGKTTLMLQYVKLHYPAGSRKALYCSVDNIYFATHSILELAENFYKYGGEMLLLDEIHKYNGWSREIKEIYDSLPTLKVVISGSSVLNIINADADLSRRCRNHDIYGLSFREYLKFYRNLDFPVYSIEDLLHQAPEICNKVNEVCRPLSEFEKYNKAGYFPFFEDDVEDYYYTLQNVSNYIIEQELPSLCGIDSSYARKIKALLCVVATGVPYEVDLTKLSQMIGLARTTTLDYLQKLEKAQLLTLLYSDTINVKKMQKPDKMYLQNTNLLQAYSLRRPHIGTVRETFAVLHMRVGHSVEYGKEHGDFVVDGKYTFEVGGKDKSFKQIADIPDSYLLVDEIEYAVGNRLPLWLIGFLY